MTYKEFREWCNDRACDGQWGMNTAMFCIKILTQIEDVRITGFHLFKKRAKDEAKEIAWQKYNSDLKIEEVFVNGTRKVAEMLRR